MGALKTVWEFVKKIPVWVWLAVTTVASLGMVYLERRRRQDAERRAEEAEVRAEAHAERARIEEARANDLDAAINDHIARVEEIERESDKELAAISEEFDELEERSGEPGGLADEANERFGN